MEGQNDEVVDSNHHVKKSGNDSAMTMTILSYSFAECTRETQDDSSAFGEQIRIVSVSPTSRYYFVYSILIYFKYIIFNKQICRFATDRYYFIELINGKITKFIFLNFIEYFL